MQLGVWRFRAKSWGSKGYILGKFQLFFHFSLNTSRANIFFSISFEKIEFLDSMEDSWLSFTISSKVHKNVLTIGLDFSLQFFYKKVICALFYFSLPLYPFVNYFIHLSISSIQKFTVSFIQIYLYLDTFQRCFQIQQTRKESTLTSRYKMIKPYIGCVFSQRNTDYLLTLIKIVLILVLSLNDSAVGTTRMISLLMILHLLQKQKLILKGKVCKRIIFESIKPLMNVLYLIQLI